jgi:anti-sigma factor RsiW
MSEHQDPARHLTERVLDAYGDDSLAPGERAPVVAHLQACPDCRLRAGEYRTLFRDLAALPRPELPLNFANRILDAVRPSENRILFRLATRAYAAAAVAMAAVAATLMGVNGPGPVAGAVTSGFTKTVLDGLTGLLHGGLAALDLLRAGLDLIPLARVLGSLARGLETAALSLGPQVHLIIAMTLILAMLVLIWATSPAREPRGVPHVSIL